MVLRSISILFTVCIGVLGLSNALFDKYTDRTITDEDISLSQSELGHGLIRSKRYSEMKDHHDDEDDEAPPMYNPDLFEGDIANPGLTAENIRSFVGDEPVQYDNGATRVNNAIRDSYKRWPNGRIPYEISSQYNKKRRQLITDAIDDFTDSTCITFVPKTNEDKDYIYITPHDGCYSSVGRVGGVQQLSLENGCLREKGTILHELMHAVGFFHEQSRADRDDYVTIKWDNIKENEIKENFKKYSLSVIDHLGTAYDYISVMHYAADAFSKNGRKTIEPKKRGVAIGQRGGFSTNDLYKINKLYNCPSDEITTPMVVTTTRAPATTTTQPTTTRSPTTTTTTPPPTTRVPATTTTQRPTTRPPTTTTTQLPTTRAPTTTTTQPPTTWPPTTTTTRHPTPTTTQRPPCRDVHNHCKFKAMFGHCHLLDPYLRKLMRSNCPVSCRSCEDIKCEDSESVCGERTRQGLCTDIVWRYHMTAHCRSSCGLC